MDHNHVAPHVPPPNSPADALGAPLPPEAFIQPAYQPWSPEQLRHAYNRLPPLVPLRRGWLSGRSWTAAVSTPTVHNLPATMSSTTHQELAPVCNASSSLHATPFRETEWHSDHNHDAHMHITHLNGALLNILTLHHLTNHCREHDNL
jgi:hypothetical protein